jgi:hypothetical protein
MMNKEQHARAEDSDQQAIKSPDQKVAGLFDLFKGKQKSDLEGLSPDEQVLAICKRYFPKLEPPQPVTDDLRQIAADMLWTEARMAKKLDQLPGLPTTPPTPLWLVTQAAKTTFRVLIQHQEGIWGNLSTKAGVQAIFHTPYEWVRQGRSYQEVRPNLDGISRQPGNRQTSIETPLPRTLLAAGETERIQGYLDPYSNNSYLTTTAFNTAATWSEFDQSLSSFTEQMQEVVDQYGTVAPHHSRLGLNIGKDKQLEIGE